MDAHAEPEAVEDRHCRKHLIPRAEHGVRRNYLLAEGIEVFIGQHNALRGACGTAGIENNGGVITFALHFVVIEAVSAHRHKLTPANHRGILRNLPDFSAFRQHISGADGLAQLILHGGNNDIDDAGVLADIFKFMVKLVKGDGCNAVRGVEIKLDLFFCR